VPPPAVVPVPRAASASPSSPPHAAVTASRAASEPILPLILRRDRLPAVEQPTLIVWGRNDRIVPVGGAYRYEQLIPDSSRFVLEDTGHVPMIERPALFNRLLEGFLTE